MIIYNITYSVEPSVADSFIQWMKENHVPKVNVLPEIKALKIYKLRTDLGEGHGVNFTFQYVFNQNIELDLFLKNHSDNLRNEVFRKFHGFYADFDTVLDEV